MYIYKQIYYHIFAYEQKSERRLWLLPLSLAILLDVAQRISGDIQRLQRLYQQMLWD